MNLNTSAIGEGVRLAATAQQFTQGNISTTVVESGSCDQRRRLLHAAGSQQRHRLYAQRPILRGQERQCRDRHRPGAAGLSADRQRRFQYRRADGPQSADRAEHAAGNHGRHGDLESAGGLAPPAGAPFNPTNPATFNQSTSTTVYDSLGNSYPATFYFTQTAVPEHVERQHDGQRNADRRPRNTLTFSSTGAVTPPAARRAEFPGLHADRRRGGA